MLHLEKSLLAFLSWFSRTAQVSFLVSVDMIPRWFLSSRKADATDSPYPCFFFFLFFFSLLPGGRCDQRRTMDTKKKEGKKKVTGALRFCININYRVNRFP
ncbi:hypothetical protein CGRA01v4_00511 [Colletotrichum graminicola]|nr:hypothetical protein CGRA01v4_00511 [Colletotrichum graminicola]